MRVVTVSVVMVLVSFTFTNTFGMQAPGQAPSASSSTIAASSGEEYRIGPRDIVELYILKVPELSRDYQVGANGTIEVPFLGKVRAQNKTSQQLATEVAEGLRNGYLIDPQVSVVVKKVNRQFFIQGAVRSPGVYNIEGRPTLLELITIAGGLNAAYSATAFIIHNVHPADAEAASEDQPQYELQKANINALLRGDLTQNAAIEPGDIVNIPPADVFFVSGDVKAPGSFALKEKTTLRQAISLAQGTTPTAAAGRGVIFREDPNGEKRQIPIDVAAVMRGRKPDIEIAPNDVIVIPNSKTKSTFVPVVNAFGVAAAWSAATIVR